MNHDAVYLVSGKYVQCLDRAGGRPLWQRKLKGLWFSSGFATILVDGNEVFVGRDGYVYCLDARTGDVLWERGIGSSGLVAMATAGSQSATVAAAHAAQQQIIMASAASAAAAAAASS